LLIEYGVEPVFQFNLFGLAWGRLIRLKIVVEVPNLLSDAFKDLAFRLIGCDQLIEGALCMNPTQGMVEDIELTLIITDNDQVFRQALIEQTAYEGALCGYFDMSVIDDFQLF